MCLGWRARQSRPAAEHAGISITSNAGFQSRAASPPEPDAVRLYVIGPWAIISSINGSAVTVDNLRIDIRVFTITGISANYNDVNPSSCDSPH